MNVLPIHPDIKKYLRKRRLLKKFEKQVRFIQNNPFHPSLHTELLEPKHMRVWSFRIDKRHRAIFIFHKPHTIEIIDVNDHYK